MPATTDFSLPKEIINKYEEIAEKIDNLRRQLKDLSLEERIAGKCFFINTEICYYNDRLRGFRLIIQSRGKCAECQDTIDRERLLIIAGATCKPLCRKCAGLTS